MSQHSRRLTTIWFADIAGFTRLSATDEALALEVMDVMRRCVRSAVDGRFGRVIKFLGDGALAEFPSAEGAVMAALEAEALFENGTRSRKGGPYQLHLGVHVGDVTGSDDGKDIFGDGVNRAQRVESLGQPGQTVVSEEVYSLLRRRPELTFTSLGHHTAKGLDDPFEVFLVGATGETADRLVQIRQGQPATRTTGRMVPVSRAFAVGIATTVIGFGGLAILTGLRGTASRAGAPIPDTIHLSQGDPELAMPVWPPRPTKVATRTAASTAVRPLADLAAAGEGYFAALGHRDLTAHEVLPLLRRALNEARDGAPRGARADAIKGIAQFMVKNDLEAAEKSFRVSLAVAPELGLTRVMYAQLLTAEGRFSEASFQLDQAKGKKDVSDGQIDAARGAVLYRKGDVGDARGALDRALQAEDMLSTRILLARAQIAQNKLDDALRTLSGRIGSPEVVAWMGYARLRADRDPNSVSSGQLLEMARRPGAGYPGALLLHAAGQEAESLDALARLAHAGDPDLIWLGVDPEWTDLRANPRFPALASRTLGAR